MTMPSPMPAVGRRFERMPLLVAAVLACAAAGTCSPPPPIDLTFEIKAVSACSAAVGPIQSVRISLIGARNQVPCIESAQCAPITAMPSPPLFPQKIEDVESRLPPGIQFDVIANRGYQIEAIGYATNDCSVGGDFRKYRFCGQSTPVKFSTKPAAPFKVPATCGSDAVTCAGLNASLRFCQ